MSQNQYDTVVVGGGIYGSCIAACLAQSGYKTALVEAQDFGSQTSANSLRTLHGGLRYLQHFNFKRFQRSVQSRRYFLQLAPQLIEAVPFHLPLQRRGLKSPLVMRAALKLSDFLSRDRNHGLEQQAHLPNSSIVKPSALPSALLGNDNSNYAAGARWHEAIILNNEALILEILKSAEQAGCDMTNHCRAQTLEIIDNEVQGVWIEDTQSQNKHLLRCKWVVDAAGFNTGQFKLKPTPDSNKQPLQWARANNFIINRRLSNKGAFGISVTDSLKDHRAAGKDDSRLCFCIPLENNTLIGTFYQHQEAANNCLDLSAAEKSRLLEQVNAALPNANIDPSEITQWHSGWLPLKPGSSVEAFELEDHSRLINHQAANNSGLLEVYGVKYTTAPAVAQDVKAMLAKHLKSN